MTEPAQTPTLIAIDWGTSSFRAWALDENGLDLARKRLDIGIMKVQQGMFAGTLQSVISAWRNAHAVPVILSGMIGSRQGWVEAPYVPCPASLDEVVANLMAVPGETNIHIVPGLSLHENGRRDVIRGEETQIFGLMPEASGTFVLPGTHSKWAKTQGERIVSFRTFMTGEVYSALTEHTILGRLMKPAETFCKESFLRGVNQSRDAENGLLASLFSVRTLGLFGDIPEEGLSDYLSGLLIGSEIRDAAVEMAAGDIAIVGDGDLVTRYETALACYGMAARTFGEDASLRGLWAVAKRAGLIAGRG